MFKGLLSYSLFNVLNSALVFLNGFLLARYTSLEIFGLLSFYQVLIIGLSQLINWNTLGLVPITLSGTIRLHFSEYRKIIHSLMVIASFFVVIVLLGSTYYISYDLSISLLMLLVVLLVSSNDIDNSRLIGLGNSLNYGLALFIVRIIQTLLIYMLGVNDLLNIKSWLILVLFSEFISLLYRRNFALFNLSEILRFFTVSTTGSSIRYIISYGIKYFPILIFGYLFQYADRYFLKIMMSPSELGLFSYALLLSSSVSIFATSLLNVFVPRIYQKDLTSSKKILISSSLINVIAGFFIILIIEYMLPFISILVGKPEIESLSYIFLFTSVGVVFQGMYKIIGALLDANILYWEKFFSFFIASAINILLLSLFFHFSNANILTISIAYLFGNLSLFMVSIYFVLSHFKSKS